VAGVAELVVQVLGGMVVLAAAEDITVMLEEQVILLP